MLLSTLLKRHLTVLLPYATIILFSAACNPTKIPTAEKTQATHTSGSVNPLYEFWKNYNFNDSTYIQDQSEQRLVDFIAAFPQYPITDVKDAIHHMLEKAESNPGAFTYFRDKYAHYLYDPNSPLRSDWYYEPVLEYLTTSNSSTETEKVRYKMQLAMVKKNQPGTTVTDFQYLNSHGKKENLHDSKGLTRVLIFYDPACPHCKEIMNQLKSSELLNTLIATKQIQIIAIDPMEDKIAWKEYQSQIPSNWTNGFDHENILIKKELYSIMAYPTLYLVDDSNKIILKDPDHGYLVNFLNAHISGR
ncbi:DUF5106 domain-containing protein [Sphingobacterium faecium]|uniref:DUF5106 domain-containing protein n=1 Tax=Sphingobacterium faecium TaxID=34087 RepID=UPI003208F270